jgi:hypothetical protein
LSCIRYPHLNKEIFYFACQSCIPKGVVKLKKWISFFKLMEELLMSKSLLVFTLLFGLSSAFASSSHSTMPQFQPSSMNSIGVFQDDPGQQPEGCTLTQGYWKNHEAHAAALIALNGGTLALGNTSYTALQIDQILDQPPSGGDALIQLAHQLIAAKLNELNGASVPASIQTAIADADNAIGDLVPRPVGTDTVVSGDPLFATMNSLASTLDDYNNGRSGVPHCDDSMNHALMR